MCVCGNLLGKFWKLSDLEKEEKDKDNFGLNKFYSIYD